jgi:hypothetical protein
MSNGRASIVLGEGGCDEGGDDAPVLLVGSFGANYRVILNDKGFAAHLTHERFEVIASHAMYLQQQITAFSSADIVVGRFRLSDVQRGVQLPGTGCSTSTNLDLLTQYPFGLSGLECGVAEARVHDQD